MHKRLGIFFLVSGLILLNGCTSIIPGVGYRVNDSKYKDFVGKRYEILEPLRIMRFTYLGGYDFLARPEMKEDKETRKIVDVPAGSVLKVEYVTRTEHFELVTSYSYIAKLETQGIFSAGFRLDSFMEWKEPDRPKKNPAAERDFKSEFLGVDAKFLKELP